jgi:hypothetical protein
MDIATGGIAGWLSMAAVIDNSAMHRGQHNRSSGAVASA